VKIGIQPPERDGTVTFTAKRGWLPSDRDDSEAWDEMIAKMADTMEVSE